MNLTPHFALEEFTNSATAMRFGIDQTPLPEVVMHLRVLAATLEVVRALLLHRLRISSGYRSPKLNAQIGGAADSAHLYGYAADFTCPEFGTPLAIAEAISTSGIHFDQLIYEQTWVHLSIAPALRGEVLTANFGPTGRTSYIPGLHA